MDRLILNFLLALTLILNGISAPWAMARMAHAGHGSSSHHVHEQVASDSGLAHASADHHAHQHGVNPGESPQAPDAPDNGSCCNGTTCQCGCVLPPALSVALDSIPAPRTGPASHAALPVLLVPHHDSPPLRPPAV